MYDRYGSDFDDCKMFMLYFNLSTLMITLILIGKFSISFLYAKL